MLSARREKEARERRTIEGVIVKVGGKKSPPWQVWGAGRKRGKKGEEW